jgi:hypothetical protein
MKTQLPWLGVFLIVLAIPIVIGISLQSQPEPTRFEREQAAWISQVAAHAWDESGKNPEVIEADRKRQAAEAATKPLPGYYSSGSELEERVDRLEFKLKLLED